MFRASLLALLLAACSGAPSGEEVVAQASAGGEVAFNVVKIDDAVLAVLSERQPPAFHRRFKPYLPPPELKIAVGDTVSVVIWEAAANGLFGNSIEDFSVLGDAASRLSPGRPPLSARTAPGPQNGAAAASLADQAALAQALGGAAALLSVPLDARGAVPPSSGAAASRGLDDILTLRSSDLGSQAGRPGTRIPDQQVGPDGAITIPFAGRVRTAGRTPAEVERRIETLLGPLALEPQAHVAVRRSAANAVTVAGEAVAGARVPLSPGGDRLLQVIAAAGGAKGPVHDTFVRLSRRGVTATVPLAALVADPEQNIFAQPGDVLTLLRQPQTISVFGAAGRNSAITFTSERMNLAEALAKAGGLLDDRADPRAVFLLRHEPVGVVRALGQPVADRAPAGLSPTVYRLDLQEAKSYLLAKRFPVRDKDIIFVAEAEAVPINRALQALAKITGPIASGLLVCRTATNC